MSTLSLAHVFLGGAALLCGVAIALTRKGTARHRALGWIYVVAMGASLVAILASARARYAPFHGYAAVVLLALAIATAAPRLKGRLAHWRAWHGALMSLSLLGAIVAVGGVVGGVAMGVGKGPAYYRMFNAVVVLVTAVGLTLIATRRAIWGKNVAPEAARVRVIFTVAVAALSTALVALQAALP